MYARSSILAVLAAIAVGAPVNPTPHFAFGTTGAITLNVSGHDAVYGVILSPGQVNRRVMLNLSLGATDAQGSVMLYLPGNLIPGIGRYPIRSSWEREGDGAAFVSGLLPRGFRRASGRLVSRRVWLGQDHRGEGRTGIWRVRDACPRLPAQRPRRREPVGHHQGQLRGAWRQHHHNHLLPAVAAVESLDTFVPHLSSGDCPHMMAGALARRRKDADDGQSTSPMCPDDIHAAYRSHSSGSRFAKQQRFTFSPGLERDRQHTRGLVSGPAGAVHQPRGCSRERCRDGERHARPRRGRQRQHQLPGCGLPAPAHASPTSCSSDPAPAVPKKRCSTDRRSIAWASPGRCTTARVPTRSPTSREIAGYIFGSSWMVRWLASTWIPRQRRHW